MLPASGPNSRKTVVSWMNATPSGISVPLRKTGCAVDAAAGTARRRPASAGSLYCLVQLHEAARQLDAAVAVERVDAERAAAADRARRDRVRSRLMNGANDGS